MGEPFRSGTSPDETVEGDSRRTSTAFGSGPVRPARLDRIFGALGDRRQRYLLYALLESEGTVVERSRLARRASRVAVATDDRGGRLVGNDVVLDLHHDRLPRLEDAGFVRYDRRQGTVRYVGSPLLEELVEHARYKEAGATR